ncbi:GFA family protein [Devosia algicola]|uniref:GFA family protein n=1 Tax=Devosia algicola TaxID=3026418 RepID=A0ABY7YSA7_9HYPH|nr:GFA family protein [Devosia algicola]WDR04126.1 GFA family protein [Devosia algicola]
MGDLGEAQLSGGCLCGTVRYSVADAFEYAANCHCANCRRATGSAFKPFGGIRAGLFALIAGKDSLLIYGDPLASHDVHCGKCGSLIYSLVREQAYVHIPLGTLADAPTMRPTAHIFVGSKAPWYEISDGLAQYEEHAP